MLFGKLWSWTDQETTGRVADTVDWSSARHVPVGELASRPPPMDISRYVEQTKTKE